MPQIEEWNEYGELKDRLASFRDPNVFPFEPFLEEPTTNISGKPPGPVPAATKPTADAAVTAPTVKSGSTSPHIQIQDPPVTTSDSKTLALRLAGEEAAAKAKENARAKLGTKPPTTEGDGKLPPTANPKAQGTEPVETAEVQKAREKDVTRKATEEPVVGSASTESGGSSHRHSVAPEIVVPPKRPSLADQCAAVSTANFKAENAEDLGLVAHHRGSAVSATSQAEKEEVARNIRKSISQVPSDADVSALRDSASGNQEETVEVVTESVQKESKGAHVAEELSGTKQDAKAPEAAGTSVED